MYNFLNIDRNYDNIQHEELRRKVDPRWTVLHDELSDCYYNFWKKGLNKPFQDYDVQSTLEESKVLFDKLHGLIESRREVALDDEYRKLPEERKTDNMRAYFDNFDDDNKNKVSRIRERVLILKQENIIIN